MVNKAIVFLSFVFMSRIQKSSNFQDISACNKAYWQSKTPQERLEVALKLIRYAKDLYRANPTNKPLIDGGVILKSNTPIERRRR